MRQIPLPGDPLCCPQYRHNKEEHSNHGYDLCFSVHSADYTAPDGQDNTESTICVSAEPLIMHTMGRLNRLEKLIEQFVEEPFVRLFSDRLMPQEVARRLVQALEDAESLAEDGMFDVPGRYTIHLHPLDLQALLRDHPNLDTQLQRELQTIADTMGVRLCETPEIHLRADSTLVQQSIRISPVVTPVPQLDHTRDLDVKQMQKLLDQQAQSPCAYLIISGQQTVDLKQPIIRIGRAYDNDIILEDRRVSRYHAQLHQRYGRFLLHDLDSTGGTTVNGFPIQEIVLHAGDTISFSGVDIIYAEDKPVCRQSDGSTQRMSSLK